MESITYAYMWLIIFVVLGFAELVSPQFVTIWFALGALLTIPFSIFNIPLHIQISVFLAISIILLLLTRPLYQKYIKTKYIATNADALIGNTGIVLEKINNDDAVGIVKTKGQIWSARSLDENIIEVGQKVDIISIQGVKLIVKNQN
jgi:membrane protein implicated in regulation of membrane protease activity